MPGADLSLLLETLREAGELALAMQAQGYGHRQKRDGTFVTDVDEAVDELLKSRIRGARPDDGWLSEESPDTPARPSKTRLWIADPIDGTRGFIQGIGPWGIGMALVDRTRLICAAINRPADGEMLHALHGEGCFRNSMKLSPAMPSRKVITPKRFAAGLEAAGFVPELDSPVPLLLRLGGIATGQFAAAISTGDKNDWDIAAGHLPVTETGGKVTRLDGSPVVYNQPQPWQPGLVAASNESIHAAILKVVRDS